MARFGHVQHGLRRADGMRLLGSSVRQADSATAPDNTNGLIRPCVVLGYLGRASSVVVSQSSMASAARRQSGSSIKSCAMSARTRDSAP